MKILVVGARGQLAAALVDVLAEKDFSVVAVGRPKLDLLKPDSLARAIDAVKPDVVVNTAAYTAVDLAEAEPQVAHAVNTRGAETVAQACSKAGLPILHISTDYVFDGLSSAPYVESDPTSPLNVYGKSKQEGEYLVAAACAEHIVIRTAWLYSATGQNFVKTMLQLAQKSQQVRVVDDQRSNPTYAPHLAGAIGAIARRVCRDRGSVPWGTYHLAGSGHTTWCGLATEAFAQSKRLGGPFAEVIPIATSDFPRPARRPHDSRLSCANIARTFAVTLPHWKDGTAECVTQLLAEGSGASRRVS